MDDPATSGVTEGFGLMFYRSRWYDPILSRFAQADTLVPGMGDAQALDRYAYTLNNPIRYNDPSGHWIETAWDIANIAWDIYEVRRDPSLANWIALAVDAGSVLLPFVPGGVGIILRGSKAAEAAVDVVSHADEVVDATRIGKEVAGEALESSARQSSQQSFKSFIKRNFRENLRRLTGKGMDDIVGLEAHHVLPNEFVRDFAKMAPDININDPIFGTWLDATAHRHWSYEYNQRWRLFLEQKRTKDEILNFARDLAKEYGFDVHFGNH